MSYPLFRAGPALLIAGLAASQAAAQTPYVVAFTPESGPPGTLVKIIGERLDAVVSVSFGGAASPMVRHVSDLHLKATVPEGAASGPIGLTNQDGVTSFSFRSFLVVAPSAPRPPLALLPPSPNPAPAGVALTFSLPEPGRARLALFDLRGRLVQVLADGVLEAGPHRRTWDGSDERGAPAAAGLYLVRLEAQGRSLVRRLVRLE